MKAKISVRFSEYPKTVAVKKLFEKTGRILHIPLVPISMKSLTTSKSSDPNNYFKNEENRNKMSARHTYALKFKMSKT